MPRSHVVIRKSSAVPPSALVQLGGLATTSGLGTLVRVASSRREPAGGSSTASAGVITALPPGDPEWASRSSGALFADRLDSQSIIDAWEAPDSEPGHITLDTSIKPPGSSASVKFAILSADDTGSGALTIPLPAFGQGATRWLSYRVYFQAEDAFAPYPTGGTPAGPKVSILSRDGNGPDPPGSNQINELVIDLMTGGSVGTGEINGYWQDGVFSGVQVELPFSSQLNGSDFRGQPSLDRGVNRFTGTNPDTGAAWSASEQERARYGNTYGARSSPGVANFKPGLGDPFQGSFRPYPGEWITITMRVIVGTWGANDSRWTCWAAREGHAYTLLWDKQNIKLGAGPNYNGVTLLPYTTNRVAGGRRVSSRTGELASCFAISNIGPTHATGGGTLSYNSTTQRFTWQANGDSAGTARGFSLVNGILRLNLISSGASNYLNGLVTPANLPGTNTSETVTIATDRPNTQRNYADVIHSANPINAYGGYAPAISDLAIAAASLSPGQWATFSMGNLTNGTFVGVPSGGYQTIGGYGSRLIWDSVHKRLQFAGCAHTGGANIAGAGGLATWDDATNTWSRETYTWSSENPGHAYQHLTADPSGNLYYRSYNSTTIRKRTYGQTGQSSWETGQVANIGGDYGNQVSGGLQWFNELNNGSGGLVFVDIQGANWTNAALSSWSTQSGDSTSGDHDQNIARAGGFVYWGGGGGSTALYRLSPTGTVTNMASLPFAANHTLAGGDGGTGAFIADPDGVGLLLFQAAANGLLRYFDGTSWSNLSNHQIGNWPFLCCSIPEYGVVVTVQLPTTSGTPVCKIYKRA